MSELIFKENPLVVRPLAAKVIGLNEVIVLQQIHYWLELSKNYRDGYKWTYKTYDEWAFEFPFWSLSTIRRIIGNLEKRGLVISTAAYNKMPMDKTKWYTIDSEQLALIESYVEKEREKLEQKKKKYYDRFKFDAFVQNEQTTAQYEQSTCVQNEQTKTVQNEQTTSVQNEQSNNHRLPKTTTKTTTENIKPSASEMLDLEFAEWYKSYPVKKGKPNALKAFKTARKKFDLETIKNGTMDYLRECEIKRRKKEFIKHPATFLNAEGFNDEYDLNGGGQAYGSVRESDFERNERIRFENEFGF